MLSTFHMIFHMGRKGGRSFFDFPCSFLKIGTVYAITVFCYLRFYCKPVKNNRGDQNYHKILEIFELVITSFVGILIVFI